MSQIINGSNHTQWWVHEIGEISSPNNCTTSNEPSRSRTASVPRARHASAASTADTAIAASTSGPYPASWPRMREIPPRQDWLNDVPIGPIRRASPSRSVK